MAMRRRFILSANKVPDNQIWYTTTDGNIIDVVLKPSVGEDLSGVYGFGSYLISNTSGAKCIIKTLREITQIGSISFRNSNIVSIQMPKYVDIIQDSAFEECYYLTHVDMPEGVTTIGHTAFNNCTSLQTIRLSEDLETIGSECFKGCSSLEVLYSKAVIPPTMNYAGSSLHPFYGTPINKIYVPFESVSAYREAFGWSAYKNIIQGYNFD